VAQSIKAISVLVLVGFACFIASAQITTSQYNRARTGSNVGETILTLQNVNREAFGKVFSFPVDGDIYAQPLYLPRISTGDGLAHNLVFVVTQHDSVYAFDADHYSSRPVWHVNLADEDLDISPVPSGDVGCPVLGREIGITSTPVISERTGTLYVLARTKEYGYSGPPNYVQRLHALDVATGAEKYGGPIAIRASVQLPAAEFRPKNPAKRVEFDPLRENQRAALLLANGSVIIAWGSLCDVGPYYGWVMAYDERTLKQRAALNTSPSSGKGGIWQSGTGLAADEKGNIYAVTGDGLFDPRSEARDFGDAVLKISLTRNLLRIHGYFSPDNQRHLFRKDLDLGSGGPILLSSQPDASNDRLIVAGKDGSIYDIDLRNMKHSQRSEADLEAGAPMVRRQSFSAPAYWNGNLYFVFARGDLMDFAVEKGRVATEATSEGHKWFEFPGATPTISSDHLQNGIVWFVESRRGGEEDVPAVLHAYEARDVSHELYSTEEYSARDRLPSATRFTIPTVVNGRVYVGTRYWLVVYGLISESRRPDTARVN
jgi:PQQ-like domain